ncbi:hypothetical protein C2W62_30785 [Candidatus Entotheonella serta]|nr:hypothetical protein C2W62_30785 [Candidatus Entotheonella serta]
MRQQPVDVPRRFIQFMARKNNKERIFPALRDIVVFNRGVNDAEIGLRYCVATAANATFGGAIDHQLKLKLVRVRMRRIVFSLSEGGRDL